MSAALEAKDAAFEAASEGGDSLNVSVSLGSDDDAVSTCLVINQGGALGCNNTVKNIHCF